MNREFCKLENDNLTYAPSVLMTPRGLVTRPTADDYLEMGYKRVVDSRPSVEAGHSARPTGWAETDGEIVRRYEVVSLPPRPVMVSKARVAAVVDEMGKTDAFFAWLNSRAAYMTAWFDGAPSVPYDEDDNASDLASLIAALGIAAEDVPALIEKVKEV